MIGAGHPTVLTRKEVEEIVATIQEFGLTKELVSVVIRDYLKDQPYRPNPFNDGVPGKDWWQLFLKRWHSEISVRKPQHLPTNRAVSASGEVLDVWFQCVKDLFQKTGLNLPPPDELSHYIWNCDETGFCTAVAAKKILVRRGAKDVHDTIGGSGRDYITVLGAGAADGTRLPPGKKFMG